MSKPEEQDLRERAVKRLKDKRDFKGHLATYVGVNAFLIIIWAIDGGFFWPMFPLIAWGVFGIVPHAWSVYFQHDMTEDEIQKEMDRLR